MATCSVCGSALPETARFCSSCGAAAEVPAATTERKLVSILFADLVGSTAFASGEDPERVRAVLDDFYEAMAEEAVAAGGTVEKFAGDAVLAAFGAASAQEDHAERALHAALAMQRRFAELFGGRLGLRIGVNTGEVAVGPARVGGSFLSGDAVNVAARLEQAAPPGEILASERTAAAVRDAFEFGDVEVVAAKGKEGGVSCRRVIRGLSMLRPRGVRGLQSAFVGRDGEVGVLLATYRRMAAQVEPHLVTVVGEPGVGKTRLVRELSDLLSGEGLAPVLLTGRCLAYGDGITYWPIGEVLKEHLGILDDDSQDTVLERLGGREMLGLALGLDVAVGLHPLDARERLHEATITLVEEIGAERPLVLVVEDIHWAEDDLLELLERVVREARAPAVVLTTARPELLDRHSSWASGLRNTTTIWLEPLPAQVTSRMLDELLGVELSPELRDLVVARAGGNPFFVEEIVAALVDAGVLEKDDVGWHVRALPEGFAVPDSVHALLAARIDRLPTAEKAALQAASVMGRVFWSTPLSHLLDGAEHDLALLEERDFIRRHTAASVTGEREYVVKHTLTREVAYASIPKARRGRLHATFAEWLERSELGKDEHASLLAYHYSEAVRPEDADLVWAGEEEELARLSARAVHWLRRAGDLARGRHEMSEAVELYAHATELSSDGHEQALLWRAIGEAQALRFDGEAMRTALLRALDGPLDDAERADTFSLLAFHASLRSAMWSIRLNRSLIERWAEKALALAAPVSEARARAILARAHVEPDATSEAELSLVMELAEDLESIELRSYALGARSAAAFERRRFVEAAMWSDRRLELLDEIEDPDHLCDMLEFGSPSAAAVGRFDEARRLAALHADLARRLSPHHWVHAVSLELELADALGDWASLAAATNRVANAVAANLATPCVRNPRGLLLCAVAHLCEGDEARALELEGEANRIGAVGYDSYLSGPRLRLAIERCDRAAADELLALAIERAFVWGPSVFATRLDGLLALGRTDLIEEEAPGLALPGTLVEPFALRALGAARGDDDLLAKADQRFGALGLEWHRAQTERLIAGV